LSTLSEVADASKELMEKYLVKGKTVPFLADSIERALLEFRDIDNMPSDADIINQIKEKPLISAMLMIGKNGLADNLSLLITNEVKWESNLAGHQQLVHSKFREEQQVGRVREIALKSLQAAQHEFQLLDTKYASIQSIRLEHEEQVQRYHRRAKFTQKFKSLITSLLSEDFQPWATAAIEDIRNKLGLTSNFACRDLLPSRRHCVAVLQVMDVMEYEQNPFFRGLWAIPPEGSVTEWKKSYGEVPNIKTSKGNDRVEQLQTRIAHYLGFRAPPPSTPFAIVASLEGLSSEQLKQVRHQVEAELHNRGTGGDDRGVGDGAGGSDDAGDGAGVVGGGDSAVGVGGGDGVDGGDSAGGVDGGDSAVST
jgi:hypothetical protein